MRKTLRTDIPQVACRLIGSSPDFVCWWAGSGSRRLRRRLQSTDGRQFLEGARFTNLPRCGTLMISRHGRRGQQHDGPGFGKDATGLARGANRTAVCLRSDDRSHDRHQPRRRAAQSGLDERAGSDPQVTGQVRYRMWRMKRITLLRSEWARLWISTSVLQSEVRMISSVLLFTRDI